MMKLPVRFDRSSALQTYNQNRKLVTKKKQLSKKKKQKKTKKHLRKKKKFSIRIKLRKNKEFKRFFRKSFEEYQQLDPYAVDEMSFSKWS